MGREHLFNSIVNVTDVSLRFQSIPLLLTDTTVSRDTKALVKGVGLFRERVSGAPPRSIKYSRLTFGYPGTRESRQDPQTNTSHRRPCQRTTIRSKVFAETDDGFAFGMDLLTPLSSTLVLSLSCNQNLISQNHQHLIDLGVSHPKLEEIREIASRPDWREDGQGLSTKLTGAGGGGCAVTLLGDGALFLPSSLPHFN